MKIRVTLAENGLTIVDCDVLTLCRLAVLDGRVGMAGAALHPGTKLRIAAVHAGGVQMVEEVTVPESEGGE